MLEENERVDVGQIRAKKQECGFTDSAVISAKEWRNFNVNNATDRALIAAYMFKYMEEEDDTDAEPELEQDAIRAWAQDVIKNQNPDKPSSEAEKQRRDP